MEWGKLLAIVGIIIIIWYLYRVLRRSPELFTAANFNKSFKVFGVLALVLIGFISFCIFLLQISK